MHHDAIVIGGSFAGLSAATYLARGRRSVRVIDAGRPRNRFAGHSHGFLTRDGEDPAGILAVARAQLAAYPEAILSVGEVVDARAAAGGGFEVELASGETFGAGKLVLAFGVTDVLPPHPGLAERWGRSVLHCPYCHGYEVSGRRLGVLYATERSVHQALLIAEWGPTTLFLDGHALPGEAAARLAERGVAIERDRVARLEGEGTALSALRLAGGRSVSLDALFIGAPTRLNGDLAQRLGCAVEDGPFGPMIRTGADRMTTVSGVYAAGDIARAPHSATWAAADGVTAGVFLHQSLVFPAPAA